MKLTRLFVFVLAAFLSWQHSARAQSINSENLRQVKIDDISEAELKAYYQKALNSGLNEQQIYKIASDRGLPESEIQKLKIRVALLSASSVSKSSSKDTASLDGGNSGIDRLVNDDAMKVQMQKVTRDSQVFGSELFSGASLAFEPNLRIPSPANYILGPDDALTINVFGYSEQVYNLTVNAEGNIYIPNVGPIRVNGVTIEEASDRIRSKLASTIYKAISTGQTRVEVTLAKIRSIRVTVIGQATKPGTYTVSSLTTLFNILYLCGGPNETGSFRSIELIRGNALVKKVDLYAFLTLGDRKDNVLLQEQDVIRIPYYNTRVLLEGAVKRPGKYELTDTENLKNLLVYSGGFSDSAYRASVQVTRITDTGIVLSDVAAVDFGKFRPQSGDAYKAAKGLNRFRNRVSITGAVLRPGDYELKAGMGLKELIELAGGLREDAFGDRGLIRRQNPDMTLASRSFVVSNVISGKENVPLEKEDLISISSILDLKDAPTVNIEGAVRNGGTFTYAQGITVKDLILKSGGFTESANISSIEVSRRIKNSDATLDAVKQSQVIKVDLSQGLSSAGGETLLAPYDIVNVRSEPGYNTTRLVYVDGQVMNAGRYVLESSRERISSLLKRAGGFKGSADSNSITIRRFINTSLTLQERQAIVERMLNLDKDSLQNNRRLRDSYLKNMDLLGVNIDEVRKNPGGNDDLILEDGDLISVARTSNLVRVNGEVFYPTLLPYSNNKTARYYIKRSGNYTNNARPSQVFVIYPNGKASSVRQFLFFRSYPEVTPRSEVFVPAKEKTIKRALGTGEWIAISSIIASLTTMVIALINASK
jgi:protein involved in polysaccharide export with SLBB domain